MGKVTKELSDLIIELEDKGNKREDTIIKQVVLLNSGALAILGVGSLSALPLSIQVLFTVAIGAIATSLLSALVYFIVDYLFYRKLDGTFQKIKMSVEDLSDKDAITVVQKNINGLQFSAGAKPFWVPVIAFMLAAIILASTIVLRIWVY